MRLSDKLVVPRKKAVDSLVGSLKLAAALVKPSFAPRLSFILPAATPPGSSLATRATSSAMRRGRFGQNDKKTSKTKIN